MLDPRKGCSLQHRGDIIVTPPIGFEPTEVSWVFMVDGVPMADGDIVDGAIAPFSSNDPVPPNASSFWINVYDAQGRAVRQFQLKPGTLSPCRMSLQSP